MTFLEFVDHHIIFSFLCFVCACDVVPRLLGRT